MNRRLTKNETTRLSVLVLEDDLNRVDIFKRKLGGRFDLCFVETAMDAIVAIQSEDFDVIFLDHDLGGEVYVSTEDTNTGSEVVRWMIAYHGALFTYNPYVIIHSLNTPAAEDMERKLKSADFPFVYRIPFTALKQKFLDDPSFLS